MPTDVRRVEGYSDISEAVLAETSIIQAVSRKDIIGKPGFTTCKVYVNELATIADYVPGTGVAISNDGSSYVTINNLKEKAVNEILDGYSIDTAPADYVTQRLVAALSAGGEQVDTDGFAKMVVDGTEDVAAAGAKPTVSTIYTDILLLKQNLDDEKAPQANRYLVITPEMHNLMLQVDSKIVLDTNRGDRIQTDGWVGRFLGFEIFVTTLLPAGTNIVALHERGFVFGMNWMRDVLLQSLDGSGTYIGDSAVQGRWAYISGAVRPTLIRLNNGQA